MATEAHAWRPTSLCTRAPCADLRNLPRLDAQLRTKPISRAATRAIRIVAPCIDRARVHSHSQPAAHPRADTTALRRCAHACPGTARRLSRIRAKAIPAPLRVASQLAPLAHAPIADVTFAA